ncbi:hypothetical protein TNCV_253721 [Trichonephila clavipes]|nr:hypothetical protein TNCV_253721 [Trichonephila clavipes]
MKAKAYSDYLTLRDLRCWGACADVKIKVVSLMRNTPVSIPQASLIFIYPPSGRMKDRVNLAQPEICTPNLWHGSTIHFHSTTGPFQVPLQEETQRIEVW